MFIIRALVLADDENVVSNWYAQYARVVKATARLDALMIHLRQQKKDEWTRPHYDTLRDGIGEIRFRVKGVLHRPLGFFGPIRGDFTFVLFATKNGDFDPSNAIDIAVRRKNLIEKGLAKTIVITRWNNED